jgi:hypothetical protein
MELNLHLLVIFVRRQNSKRVAVKAECKKCFRFKSVSLSPQQIAPSGHFKLKLLNIVGHHQWPALTHVDRAVSGSEAIESNRDVGTPVRCECVFYWQMPVAPNATRAIGPGLEILGSAAYIRDDAQVSKTLITPADSSQLPGKTQPRPSHRIGHSWKPPSQSQNLIALHPVSQNVKNASIPDVRTSQQMRRSHRWTINCFWSPTNVSGFIIRSCAWSVITQHGERFPQSKRQSPSKELSVTDSITVAQVRKKQKKHITRARSQIRYTLCGNSNGPRCVYLKYGPPLWW